MRLISPRLNLGKLILALALLSAIIALANTLLASYRVQRDQLVGNTLEANRVYATKLAETTQNFLLAAQQELAYAATRLGQDDLDPQRAQDEASRLQLQTNSFNSSLVVDADGLVIATSPQTLQLQGEVLHSVGNNAALAARQPMISDPYQSATGKLLVSLSHPIFNRQGHYRGYVSGTLYLRQRSALHTLLGKHYYRDGSYLYVVDRHGRLLYHADGKRVGDYVVGNPAVKAVVRGERGAQQVRNNLGVSMLAGYAPVPATGWGIIAQRPTEATLQPLSRLMTAVIWNAIPLGLLSLLVTWWFARRISMPLWQLARNVQGGEDTGNAINHVSGIRALVLRGRTAETRGAAQLQRTAGPDRHAQPGQPHRPADRPAQPSWPAAGTGCAAGAGHPIRDPGAGHRSLQIDQRCPRPRRRRCRHRPYR